MSSGVTQPPPGTPPGGNQLSATSLLAQMPLGAIIGGPLKAAVDAQAAAAVACTDFIQKIGFDQGAGAGATTTVKNVTFTFQSTPSGGGPPETLSISVPILTIMPLPFIRIETLSVNFKASIAAVDERSESEKKALDIDGKLEGSVGFPLWKAGVSGSISSKKDSTATNTSKYSVEYTMDISVHAVQDDMPAGLSKLLAIMTERIR
jgi:hypothetical protein